MKGKKYISKPDLNRRKIRLDDFEYINEFSKLKFDRMPDDEIDNVVAEYIKSVLLDQSTQQFSDFARIHFKYENLKSESGYEKLRVHFKELQKSLIEKINEVQSQLKSLDKQENKYSKELLSFDGKVTIVYHRDSSKFETKYLPSNFNEKAFIDAEYPDLKIDCEMLKAQYFDIISYLLQELPDGRFKICEKCSTPFFQATVREKLFCSYKCSRAVAQANYMKNKTKGGDTMIKE